jgi:putative ABC transport system permease protein
LEKLLQDIRYGARSLGKSPHFAIAAVFTLALGIGANTAMFSIVRAVLLRPWPFPSPMRLLFVSQRQEDGSSNLFSTRDFLEWKKRDGILSGMGAHVSWKFNLNAPGTEPERIPGAKVSSDWLPILGVEPMLGRFFSAQEDIAGAGNFVVLSRAIWQDRYGANRNIVGNAIRLDGAPYTVVGVMPAGFNGFDGTELLWTPLQLRPDSGPGSSPNIHWLSGCIRLPNGVNLVQARSSLEAVASRLHREYPTDDLRDGVDFQELSDAFTANAKPALLMLFCCVGFLLLIACANVANLSLARGAIRQREMAVRAALGASPVRIVRQLLTESLLVAGAGGAIGIAFAVLLMRGILAVHAPAVPRIEQTRIDGTVLAYLLLISVVVTVLFGLAPAIQAARVELSGNLGQRGNTANRGIGRHHSFLAVAETGLACILLIGTGLALRSLWSLRGVNLGIASENVLTFRIAPPAQLTGSRIPDFYGDVVDRIRAIRGVQVAAVARDLPFSGTDPSMPFLTEGKWQPPLDGRNAARYRVVGDDYFRTLSISLIQGRAFDKRDTASSRAVAIVSESLARQYWPGENPVGQRMKPRFAGSSWCAVIGVVSDVRHWGADVAAEPTAYYPYTQVPDALQNLVEKDMSIAVRTGAAQSDLLHSISAAVATVNPDVPVFDVKTMDSMVAESDSLRDFDLLLLALFSFLSVTLAGVGVYAVMAYFVSQRTREIGIRMALGASSRDVLRLILRQGATVAFAGSLIGVVGASLLRKVMANLLYGLCAIDPATLCIVPAIMVVIVLLACWLPGRRALDIDPIIALHYD